MKDYKNRYLIIAIVTAVAILCLYPPKEKLKLGIDLAGGTILIYEVAGALELKLEEQQRIPSVTGDASKGEESAQERFAGGTSVKFNANKPTEIQVISAKIDEVLKDNGVEKPEDSYTLAKTEGSSFELRTNYPDVRGLLDEVNTDLRVDYGVNPDFSMDQLVASLGRRVNPGGQRDVTLRPLGQNRVEIILPAADPQFVQDIQDRVSQVGQLEFKILAHAQKHARDFDFERAKRMFKENGSAPPRLQWVRINKDEENDASDAVVVDEEGNDVFVIDPESDHTYYALTLIPRPGQKVTSKEGHLKTSQPDLSQLEPQVSFHLNTEGAIKFASLTTEFRPDEDNTKYRLAIVLDDEIMSAPRINQPITGGDGVIQGNFTMAEVENLCAILNAGALPAMLQKDPVSKDTITATLGEDTVKKGTQAILIAMIAVPIFMLLYYFVAGLVANVALALNLVLLLGFMGFTQSTFTLPGLAGLALTVGMAVDANVLIFERIREELKRGGVLGLAVRTGYDKAWLTIFDSNLTTIIVGLVLWFIGTDQIRGFALTLTAGLVINLFTAVFVSRTIMEPLATSKRFRRLIMADLVRPPQLDFVGPRKLFMGLSAIVIVAGLICTGYRNTDMLDIDFLGGTAISVELTEDETTENVRALAEAGGLPSVKVERLILEGEEVGDKGNRFLIRTTEAEQSKVRNAIKKQFSEKLAVAQLKIESSEPIEEPSTSDGNEARGDQAEKKDESEKAEADSDEPTAPIQFAGGTKVQLSSSKPVLAETVSRKINDSLLDKVPEPSLAYSLKSEPQDSVATSFVLLTSYDEVEGLIKEINGSFKDDPVFERENNFGGQVAGETKNKAILAMLFSWIAIIVYLWFRFRNPGYGLAAVVALVHDVLITLGIIAFTFSFKIDLSVVAAFLTIIGFSVNDTIVIFDRVREVKGKAPTVTPEIVNKSINQCMSRTILTSVTSFLVAAILFFFGGPGVHTFAFAVMIGCITGTYSTIFIASPILITFASRYTKTITSTRKVAAAQSA